MTEISSSEPRTTHLRTIGRSLGQVLRGLDAARDRTARELSLHPTDFACIGFMLRNGPVSPREVIAYLGLSSGSGTALFDRLESHGYLRRIPNPADRRSLLLELDKENAATILARYLALEQSFLAIVDGFSDADLATVARFLEDFETVTQQLG